MSPTISIYSISHHLESHLHCSLKKPHIFYYYDEFINEFVWCITVRNPATSRSTELVCPTNRMFIILQGMLFSFATNEKITENFSCVPIWE